MENFVTGIVLRHATVPAKDPLEGAKSVNTAIMEMHVCKDVR